MISSLEKATEIEGRQDQHKSEHDSKGNQRDDPPRPVKVVFMRDLNVLIDANSGSRAQDTLQRRV